VAPLGPRHHRVTRLHDLLRRPGDRAAARACVLEGPVLAREAVASGLAVEAVFVGIDALDAAAHAAADDAVGSLVAACERAGVPVVALAAGVAERVATTVTPRPVLAVVAIPEARPDLVATVGLAVVLVGVADPGNVGTIARSSAAAGAGLLVVCGDGAADPWGPKSLRASAGALLRIPVERGPDGVAALAALRAAGVELVGGVARGGAPPDALDLTGRVALVVGSEAHGLAADVVASLDQRATIPMAAGTESLNAAMAATVLCFEAARQRRAPRPTSGAPVADGVG
jgi:RNA methyltransferase, TrmH family